MACTRQARHVKRLLRGRSTSNPDLGIIGRARPCCGLQRRFECCLLENACASGRPAWLAPAKRSSPSCSGSAGGGPLSDEPIGFPLLPVLAMHDVPIDSESIIDVLGERVRVSAGWFWSNCRRNVGFLAGGVGGSGLWTMPECVPRILDPQPHPNPALKPALPVNELGVTLLALLVQRCGGGSAAAAAAAAADAGEAGRGPDQDGGPVQGASPETDDHGPHARHRSALPRPHHPTHPPPTACTVRGSQRPWAQAPSRWCVAPSASCAGWRTARTSRSARSPPAPRPHPTRAEALTRMPGRRATLTRSAAAASCSCTSPRTAAPRGRSRARPRATTRTVSAARRSWNPRRRAAVRGSSPSQRSRRPLPLRR